MPERHACGRRLGPRADRHGLESASTGPFRAIYPIAGTDHPEAFRAGACPSPLRPLWRHHGNIRPMRCTAGRMSLRIRTPAIASFHDMPSRHGTNKDMTPAEGRDAVHGCRPALIPRNMPIEVAGHRPLAGPRHAGHPIAGARSDRFSNRLMPRPVSTSGTLHLCQSPLGTRTGHDLSQPPKRRTPAIPEPGLRMAWRPRRRAPVLRQHGDLLSSAFPPPPSSGTSDRPHGPGRPAKDGATPRQT